MNPRTRRALLAATAAAGTIAAAPAGASAAETIYAVTADEELTSFSSDAPGRTAPLKKIAGLESGESLEGIDVRPRTGAIYALGSTGRLYRLDAVTAKASFVSTVTPAPSGDDFAVDFNPVPDRLRIVSDTGQNLRVNVDTGVATVDGTINPAGARVTAAGYENAFAGATTTRLFDVDTASDRLRLQSPPNDGTLADVGALGVDASADAALDIAPSDNAAYAALRPEGEGASSLYTVSTASGAASKVGAIGGGKVVTGIAIARQSVRTFGVTTGNVLVSFASTDPSNVATIGAVTGLQAGEDVEGIDVRPATGELFALGSSGRVYKVNTATAAATQVGAGPLSLTGGAFGFDFNPVPDRIRITSDAEQNLRVNPTDATATVDGALNPGDPAIVASAYTDSYGGATATTLYNVDRSVSPARLTRQVPPNDGTQVPVGSLGVPAADTTSLDIAPQDNAALAAIAPDAATPSTLYRVSLAGGAATAVGPIGAAQLRGIAASDAGSVGLTADAYTGAQLTLVRDGSLEGTVTVGWSTSGGTSAGGAVTFAPGERLKPIDVPVAAGSGRSFTLELARGAGGYRLGTTKAAVTVPDPVVVGVPVPVPAPPVADTSKPIALIIGQDRKLATLRSKGVNVLYSVNEAATLKLSFKLGTTTVGTATTTRTSAGIARLNVKLTTAGKKAVGSTKTRRLIIEATVTDPSGNVATTRSSFNAKR